MKVYVATALTRGEDLRALRDRLGLDLTLDWSAIPGHPPGSAAGNLGAMASVGRMEVRAVVQAKALVILLVDGERQRGTHIEFGVALGQNIPIVLVGSQAALNEVAFYALVAARVVREGDWVSEVGKALAAIEVTEAP